MHVNVWRLRWELSSPVQLLFRLVPSSLQVPVPSWEEILITTYIYLITTYHYHHNLTLHHIKTYHYHHNLTLHHITQHSTITPHYSAHTHTLQCTHTHTHTHAHAHMHTRTHTHMHTHACTHTHARTHTHTLQQLTSVYRYSEISVH